MGLLRHEDVSPGNRVCGLCSLKAEYSGNRNIGNKEMPEVDRQPRWDDSEPFFKIVKLMFPVEWSQMT